MSLRRRAAQLLLDAMQRGGDDAIRVLRMLPQRSQRAVREAVQQGAPAAQRALPPARSAPTPAAVRQMDIPLRNPAGAESLAPRVTQAGRQIPAGTRVGGRYYAPESYATPRNIETIRSGGPRIGDVPAPSAPAPQGQMSILSPRAEALAQQDPGTFASVQGIATRAEQYYGLPPGSLLNRLVEPDGTDVLRALDAGVPIDGLLPRNIGGRPSTPPGALVPSPGGLTRSPGGQVAAGMDPGAIVPSPGGRAVDGRIFGVDVTDLGSSVGAIAGGRRAAAGGMPIEDASRFALAARNAAGGIRMGDLGLLAAVAGLGAAGAATIPGLLESLGGGTPDIIGPEGGAAPIFREEDGSPLGEAGSPEIDAAIRAADAATRGGDPSRPGTPVTMRGAERDSARREALSQYAPDAAALDRALEPRDPSQYQDIADYYRDREAYSRSPETRKQLVEAARQMQVEQNTQADLAAWAQANPQLMYELQRRQLANPAASQQSPESVTSTTITAPLGAQNENNAVGQAEAAALAASTGDQGAYEMVDATRPQEQPRLQRARDFLNEQVMAPRSRMYAGIR